MSPLPITNNLLNEQGRACSIRPRPSKLLSLAAGLLLIGWMEAYADLPPGDPLDLKRLQATEETNRRLEEEKRQLEQQQTETKRQAEQAAKENAELRKKTEAAEQELARQRLEKNTLSEEVPVGVGGTMKDCGLCPELVVIPPGEFVMGSPDSEKDRSADESPQHTVKIGYILAVGKYEVTRGEFAHFADETNYKTDAERGIDCYGLNNKKSTINWRNPNLEQDDRHPLVCVSWNDAQAYIQWLNRKSGLHFRLLSEAEWEYAARGGKGNRRFPWGDDLAYTELCRYANGADKAAKKLYFGYTIAASCSDAYVNTSPAGSQTANPFGLYDLHGNVSEWVEDCYENSYARAPNDGSTVQKTGCSQHMRRGGSYREYPSELRSANRYRYKPGERIDDSGFRLARRVSSNEPGP